MTQVSDEQSRIINAPLAPLSVIACAGSGKTFTAVRRLASMRQQLGKHRGRVALLSFSNVAVETFRREYRDLVQDMPDHFAHERVEIDTLDGFITGNVLRPHAYRTMGAQQSAFLVTGAEAFLSGFKFQTSTYPREVTTMQVGIDAGGVYFCHSEKDVTQRLDTANARQLVHRLGKLGAYTHNLGRYWCHRTLDDQPKILCALVRRYPHILIDEAQDIGTLHQAIIEQLVGAGCQVSLIGDPNQGIYEFAGANGAFLRQYGHRQGVNSCGLTKNYRSVPAILDLANRLSTRADLASRDSPTSANGAFFAAYRKADRSNLIAAFQAAVLAAGLRIERSAVLCRGRALADEIAGRNGAPGQGTVHQLAQAAILRDRHQDYRGAFNMVAACVVGLLAAPPHGLLQRITQPGRDPGARLLRRLVWGFTRNAHSGLPAVGLIAATQWHPRLVASLKELLATIAQSHTLATVDNLGNRLARKGLPNAPLIAVADLVTNKDVPRMRVDTVHQAKGESLDAVLYLANREHVSALLAGVTSELGRIGYVAVTRARNLLWVGIPADALTDLKSQLAGYGIRPVPAETKGSRR